MKDLNDLILQFDDLQDLPVSEELLGAYLEHTLTGSDLRDVQNVLNSNDIAMNLVDNVEENIPTSLGSSLSIDDVVQSTDVFASEDFVDGISPIAMLTEIVSTNFVGTMPNDEANITSFADAHYHSLNIDDNDFDCHLGLNVENMSTNGDSFNNL